MARFHRNTLLIFVAGTANPVSAFVIINGAHLIRQQHSKEHIIIRASHSDADETISYIFTEEDSSILQTPSLSQSTWNAEDDWTKLSSTYSDASDFRGEYDKSVGEADLLLAAQYDVLKKKKFGKDWEPSVTDVPTLHDDSFIRDDTDKFVDHAVETILNHLDYGDGDVALYDTKLSLEAADEDHHDDEMVYMIRCNQTPEQLLLSQGKMLPELTDKEKYKAEFLFENPSYDMSMPPKMTPFFKDAVRKIFDQYTEKDGHTSKVMDRNGMAKWMTRCLSYDPSLAANDSNRVKIGPHDNSISAFLSRYCHNNGSGQLTFDDFSTLYLESAWIGFINDARKNSEVVFKDGKYHPVPPIHDSVIVKDRKNTEQFLKDASLSIVWRDLEAHGIFSPAEIERVQMMKKLEDIEQSLTVSAMSGEEIVFDECELLDDYEDRLSISSGGVYGVQKNKKSSHELVEMARDGKTPKRIRDGEFDEESCIGCSQCATIAPDSFTMLEDTGRARAFLQRRSVEVGHAVLSCPVNCMHMVSYDELSEMETCRDEESFGGRTHVPVHVAGRDSDANRRSSWYHYLKGKCGSTSCPQRGCYDCPKYAPGENPYFKSRHQKAEHIRANDFKSSGDAERWRKVAEV